MTQLKIITSTTRPERKGTAIANWFLEIARQRDGIEVELLDLAVINLPMMDEPHHPRLQKYQHEHTRQWSRTIDSADAYVIILSEYNFSFPAPIKNALDYVYNEWGYKPVGFVSYGGISGGLRSMQMLKQVVTTMKMMPMVEAVSIPFFGKYIDGNGRFTPEEVVHHSAVTMLDELLKWSDNLKLMRKK